MMTSPPTAVGQLAVHCIRGPMFDGVFQVCSWARRIFVLPPFFFFRCCVSFRGMRSVVLSSVRFRAEMTGEPTDDCDGTSLSSVVLIGRLCGLSLLRRHGLCSGGPSCISPTHPPRKPTATTHLLPCDNNDVLESPPPFYGTVNTSISLGRSQYSGTISMDANHILCPSHGRGAR